MAASFFPSFSDRIREFFTLRETERTLRALPESPRAALTRGLTLAFQRRDAAETLWPRGSTAEAYRLAREALDSASSALDSFAAEASPPRWIPAAQAIAADARKRTAEAAVPELEADTQPSHEATFRALIDSLFAIEDTAGLGLASPRDIARVRVRRWVGLVAAGAAAIAFLAWYFHVPTFKAESASGQISPQYGADAAIDGDTMTFWGAPNGQPGWLDLTLTKARAVHVLRVEAGNPITMHRQTKDAHIECFLADAVVKAVDVSFPEVTAAGPHWTDVAVNAPKCDRIRISASTFYDMGAVIAEIQVN
jgi:hypothetical protein